MPLDQISPGALKSFAVHIAVQAVEQVFKVDGMFRSVQREEEHPRLHRGERIDVLDRIGSGQTQARNQTIQPRTPQLRLRKVRGSVTPRVRRLAVRDQTLQSPKIALGQLLHRRTSMNLLAVDKRHLKTTLRH